MAETLNTHENGNCANRVLCTVIGVVTPYERLFRIWIEETGKKMYGDKYKFVLIRKIDDVRGREFFAVEKGINYQDVDVEIYDAAVMRIR